MNETMVTRGPDGERIWFQEDNICGLGHRRLAILDLSPEANQLMIMGDGQVGIPICWSGAEAFCEYDKKRILSDTLKVEIGYYTSFEAIRPTFNKFKKSAWERLFINWMSYADLRHHIPELLLMRVDKISMSVSLECREPFLDQKFVEIAMSIPQRKTAKGSNKAVLKNAVRCVIPDEIMIEKTRIWSANM